MIDLGLEGARAIVVGAGFLPERAGHGRGTALRLAAAGATVACIDLDEGRAKQTVAEIEAAGGAAVTIVGDVTDPDEATRAIDEAVAALDGVDVLADIVGEARFMKAAEHTNEAWDWEIQKNLSQLFYVIKAVVPHMIRQGTGGSIAAISSVDGIGSSKYHVAYGAAKAGVLSLVRTYSEELGPYGIRVNAVAPGNVGGGNWDAPDVPFGADPVNPLSPPRAMDIANAMLFLSSSLAARITGQTIVVDGGASTRNPWGFQEEQLESMRERMPSVGGRPA
ncbi:MAG: SDR family oxidoreductase [Ilumatobacteraceae bacterium]